MIKFPSVKDVAWELRALNSGANGQTTVRFQILDNGNWWVHVGDASADLKEHGYCATGEVPGCTGKHHKPRKFNSEELAERLIGEAQDIYLKAGGNKDAKA